MLTKTLISLAALAAVAATAGPATAADTVVAPLSPGTEINRMTALDDTIVWIDGRRLMERSPDGTVAPVRGAPKANYLSIDLGRDGYGATVLTYLRCDTKTRCGTYSDDLDGHRVRFKRLAPKGCVVTSAPARWGSRVAYGLQCAKLGGAPRRFDNRRSGLFVRKGAQPPKRLRLPGDIPVPAEVYSIDTVDLRGTNVAALVTDSGSFSYEVVQTIDAKNARSAFVAGGGDEARDFDGGVSLGTAGSLWTLTYGFESSDSYSQIDRLADDGCRRTETLPDPPSDDYPATAMATDGDRIFLFVRGTGIVAHAFAPDGACTYRGVSS